MKRRTKQDMQDMRHDVRCYLLETNNDPHVAHEMMIKEYLTSGRMIPYYIKGVKDFIAVSQQLAVEWNRKEQMNKSDRLRKEDHDKKVDKIMDIGLEEMKSIYRQWKDKVNEDAKIMLVDVINMIACDEMDKKHINNSMVRLFDKIWNEIDKEDKAG